MMIPFYNLSLQEVYCPDRVLLRPADSLFLKDHHPLQAATCLTLPCFSFLGVKNTNLTSSGEWTIQGYTGSLKKRLKSLKIGK